MWKWVLLFVLLTPGVLFTIPPFGKKFVGGGKGKLVTAVLHSVVFAVLARFFMLCSEGFQEAQEYKAPCPPGQDSPDGTPASCAKCPAGSNSPNGDQCRSCTTGTYSDIEGATQCTPCASGTYSGPGATSCYAAAKGQAIIGSCSAGEYLTADLLSLYYPVCRTCRAGTASSGGTKSSCTTCTAGKYSGAGASSCTACKSGRSNAGRTACT